MSRTRHTRSKSSSEDSSFTIQQGVLMAAIFVALAITVHAAQPTWWTAPGGPLNSNPTNDYAVANQGQLKQFTQKAVLYMDTNLPSGAGVTLDGMVAGWSNFYATNGYSSTNPAPQDFNVVNQGQLKYIGNLMWTNLVAAGYTNTIPTWLTGTNANDYVTVNLGQVKTIFNFDLLKDSDTNGLPDWWEKKYFGQIGNDPASSPDGNGLTLLQDFTQGNDPNNYYSQGGTIITPVLTITGGNNQSSNAGNFTPDALIVQVKDASGTPLYNAPVTFNVVSGGGQLATDPLSTTDTMVQTSTDTFGYAQVYYLQPSGLAITSTISASSGGQSVSFSETTTTLADPPTVSPAPGSYSAAQTITVSSTLSGATIYYTTDGSAPSASSSSVASGGTILVDHTQVLNLMVMTDGYTSSTTTTALYRIGSSDLVAANSFSMFRKPDGTVWTWGNNGVGQQGDNHAEETVAVPQPIPSFTGIAAVAGAGDHALALDGSGNVWAWGLDDNSQCGDGGTSNLLVPTQLTGLSNVASIFAGSYQGFAVTLTGTLYAWGINDQGQLGDGTTTNQTTPELISPFLPPNVTIVKIASNQGHTLALASDGSVWATGANPVGELGDGTTNNASTFEQVPGLLNVTDIAAGDNYSMALLADGSVWGWGTNGNGRLGGGTGPGSTVPQPIILPLAATAIAAVSDKSYAVMADGTVYCFGHNYEGEMGIGYNPRDQLTPVQPLGINNVSLLAAGDQHVVICTTSGAFYGWGSNGFVQLTQDFNNFARNTEVHDDSLQGFTQVASSDNATIALKADGTVWAFGDGGNGTLGQGGDNWFFSKVPHQVTGLSNITQVGGCNTAAFAIDNAGAMTAWGGNWNGQLGIGNNDYKNTPTAVQNVSNVISASSGDNHLLIVQSDGSVWATGNNDNGQLGDATTTAQNSPIAVSALVGTPVLAAAAGANTSFVLDATGAVWAWGSNGDGRLGLGTTGDVSTPTPITSLPAMVRIAARGAVGIGIDVDGNVWTWGAAGNGDGTPLIRSEIANAVAITTSRGHQLALLNDGTLWGVGYGYAGQMGDGGYPFNWGMTQFFDMIQSPSDGSLSQGNPVQGVVAISANDNSTYIVKQDGTLSSYGLANVGQEAAGLSIYNYAPKPLLGIALNETPPTVTLATTVTGTLNSMGTSIALQATATASTGSIDHVDFYLEGVKLGTSSGSGPWVFSYIPPSYGNYTFEAIAYDTAGVAQISAPVTCTIAFDLDNNGLADWWELRTLSSLGNNTASLAPSGDGNTLLQEYLAQIGSVSSFTGFTMGPPTLFARQNGDDTVTVSFSTLAAATVYYTTDGSTPTTGSNSGPVDLGQPTTVSYAAFIGGVQVSPVATNLVGPVPATPIAITATPGQSGTSVNIDWVNTSITATHLLVQQKIHGSWVTVDALYPGATTTEITDLSPDVPYEFQIVTIGQLGFSSPAPSGAVTPGSRPSNYVVVDLGPNLAPIKITNAGYVLCVDSSLSLSSGVGVWSAGTFTALLPSTASVTNSLSVNDISETGTVVGVTDNGTSYGGVGIWNTGQQRPSQVIVGPEWISHTPSGTPIDHHVVGAIQPAAIDDAGNLWTWRSLPTYDPAGTLVSTYNDGFKNEVQIGTAYQDFLSVGVGGTSVFPIFINKDGDLISSDTPQYEASYYALHDPQGGFVQTLDFNPTDIGSRINGAPLIVGLDNTYPFPIANIILWNGSSHKISPGLVYPDPEVPSFINPSINGATTTLSGSAVSSAQMVADHRVWNVNSSTGQASNALNLNRLVDPSQWNSIQIGFSPIILNPSGPYRFSGHSINDGGAIVGTATLTTVSGTTTTTSSHGIMMIPASFQLRDVNNVSQGWDAPSSSSDGNAWTMVSTPTGTTSHTNSLVKLVLPPNAQNLGLECVVDDTDGGYSAACISIPSITITGTNTNIDITGIAATATADKPDPYSSEHLYTTVSPKPAHIVLRQIVSKQVLLTLNVIVLAAQTATVDIDYIDDSANSPSVISTTTPSTTTIINALNEVFQSQANITFSLHATHHITATGDFNSSGGLDYHGSSGTLLYLQPKIGDVISRAIAGVPGGTISICIVKQLHDLDGGGANGVTQGIQCLVNSNTSMAVFAHEVGHALGLSSKFQGQAHAHDLGPWPIEFKTIGYLDQYGLMNSSAGGTYWIRSGDWSQANDQAVKIKP